MTTIQRNGYKMSSKENIGGHNHLIANRYGDVTDWSGHLLSKKAVNCLRVGDIVRVQVDDVKCGSTMAPYFDIVKVKDGTLWGKARNCYGTLDWMEGLHEGDIFPFRKHHVIEIPITWQSKKQQRKLEQFRLPKGYTITGCR